MFSDCPVKAKGSHYASKRRWSELLCKNLIFTPGAAPSVAGRGIFIIPHPAQFVKRKSEKKIILFFFPKPLDIPIEIAYTIDTVKEGRTYNDLS